MRYQRSLLIESDTVSFSVLTLPIQNISRTWSLRLHWPLVRKEMKDAAIDSITQSARSERALSSFRESDESDANALEASGKGATNSTNQKLFMLQKVKVL